MDGSYIATLDLLAVHADGTRTPVALRIGAPEQVAAGEWRCAIRLDGLHDHLRPMHGADSVQALCLALRLAATLLRDFVARGGRLQDRAASADTDAGADAADWPLEAYFGWLGPARAPAT
jgi:hypothetical protein